MKVKMILPALTEAKGPFWRPIKYSLFPPLGLATLAGYLNDDDDVILQDEHVETLDLDDEPDLVGESGWPGVLDGSLADPRLDEFEIRDAGQAVPAPESKTNTELYREHGEERPEAGQDGQGGPDADGSLVEAGSTSVNDL